MKVMTVEEASPGLGRLVELALAGEQIQIFHARGCVELRPARRLEPPPSPATATTLTPREALRMLQVDARLTSAEIANFVAEMQAERHGGNP